MLEDMCAAQQRSLALADYPRIFYLLNINTIQEEKYCLEALVSLALKERPSLVVVVAGRPRHVRFLWRIERLSMSFTNYPSTDGQTDAFYRDMVEVTFSPTININPTWW